MKPFTEDSKYYYPLPKKTMRWLFKSLFRPFARGMSSTLFVKKGFGGGKAMTKFMVDHVDELGASTKLPVTTKTHRYVYVDPDEMTESTKPAYLEMLFDSFAQEFSELTRPKRIGHLIDLMGGVIRKTEVVFVLRGVNYLEFADSNLWANLGSLWQHSGRVHFMFIFYEGAPIDLSDSRFDRIREILSQNIVRFDTLSKEDIVYVIDRWSYMLEYEFSDRDRKEIIRVSRGYPSLIKPCCFAVAEMKGVGDHTLEEYPGVKESLRKIWARGKSSEGRIYSLLSPKEYAVYLALEKRKEGVVTKEKIAEAMWPHDLAENYSEAAIVRLIGRIRKKCDQHNIPVKIRAVYGRGYVLEAGM